MTKEKIKIDIHVNLNLKHTDVSHYQKEVDSEIDIWEIMYKGFRHEYNDGRIDYIPGHSIVRIQRHPDKAKQDQ